MNTRSIFPSRLHWSAQDLAAAVPLRLCELYRFQAGDANAAENAPRFARPKPARALLGGYVRPAPLPTRFSVHH